MPSLDWNKVFEISWRILVFIVTIAIIVIVIVTTNWNRWEGGAAWQRTKDAYLEADLTPVTSKVAAGWGLCGRAHTNDEFVTAAPAEMARLRG